jgi:hypothetical protein
MKQLDIEFFFPLTEQIPLDLDYKKTYEYEEDRRKKFVGDSITISTVGNSYSAISLTTNVIDWENSTRLGNWEIENSKRKPGIIQKILMKNIFGMKWMGK